jgi:hypothetical protein
MKGAKMNKTEMKWTFKPFNTAPKVGFTNILALESDGDLMQVYWDEEEDVWCDQWNRPHPHPHLLVGWMEIPERVVKK